MDDTLVTNAEPQVVETDNSAVVSQDINVTPQDDGSQVVEQATPMDDNVTYNNIQVEPAINTDRDFTQNMIENAIHIDHDINQDNNAGVAMDNFLNHEYDYDRNEAGTYWVAGAINDVDTQMSFLNTLINEEMYDEMDLQKYYYDTTMATARAYAAQKKKETAYGFYRAAQEKAIAEAELTGWYMPAEGNYMLGQYTVAQNVLEDPNAPDDARARANRITGTVEKWFAANQIGTRGIKCLNMMNYEENVRHNTIMGELQHEANQIARAGNAIAAAGNDLKLREFKFQLEEYELQTGHNITREIGLDNESTIGHNVEQDYPKYQMLRGYKDGTIRVPKVDKNGKYVTVDKKDKNGNLIKDKKGNVVKEIQYEEKDVTAIAKMLANDPTAYSDVLTISNSDYVNSVLEANGINSKDMYVKYRNDQSYASMKAFLNSEEGRGKNYITEKSGAFEKTGKKIEGKEIETITVNNKVVAGYFEGDVFVPLTGKDKNRLTQDGKTTIEKYLNKAFNDRNIDWSGTNSVEIDGETYTFGRSSTATSSISANNLLANNWKKYYVNNWDSTLDEKGWNKVYDKMKESEGSKGTLDTDGNTVRNLTYVPDKYDTKDINEYIIFSGTVDGKEQYYSVTEKGELKKLNSKDIEDIPHVSSVSNGDTGAGFGETNMKKIMKASWIVGYDKKEDVSYMALPRSDGSIEYFTIKGKSNDVESGKWAGTVKMVNNNVSAKDVEAAGLKPLENKVANKTAKANVNTTRDEDTIDYPSVSPSGGGAGRSFDGYEAQDTVTNRYGLFEKYNVDLLEQPKYADIRDLDKLEEALQERNNINSFNQTKTTYTKPKVQKKGGK